MGMRWGCVIGEEKDLTMPDCPIRLGCVHRAQSWMYVPRSSVSSFCWLENRSESVCQVSWVVYGASSAQNVSVDRNWCFCLNIDLNVGHLTGIYNNWDPWVEVRMSTVSNRYRRCQYHISRKQITKHKMNIYFNRPQDPIACHLHMNLWHKRAWGSANSP